MPDADLAAGATPRAAGHAGQGLTMPVLASCARAWVHSSFRAMGTEAEVTVLADSERLAGRLLDRAAPTLERLEARWSRFRPGSELCRLNASAGTSVVVSEDTFDVVARAVEAWRATSGRFDPTVLPALLTLGYDRDFGAIDRHGPSTGRARAPTSPPFRAAPGCAEIELDAMVSMVRLPRGLALDLGGIGKGLAADRLARELLEAGADGVCVDLGGDLHVGGIGPHAAGWVVGVDDPLATGATGSLTLRAGGVATSTRLRRAWTLDGEARHHLVDPRTGGSAWTGLASVTVVAAETWWAEVLAKAAFVAGADAGAQLLVDAGVTGLMVDDDGGVLELPGLPAFRR